MYDLLFYHLKSCGKVKDTVHLKLRYLVPVGPVLSKLLIHNACVLRHKASEEVVT